MRKLILCFTLSLFCIYTHGQITECTGSYSTDAEYKVYVSDHISIIDSLMDTDLKSAITTIDFFKEKCLKEDDYCNKCTFISKKSTAYAFSGDTKNAELVLKDAGKMKEKCISPAYGGYQIAMANYFISMVSGNEATRDSFLQECIFYAGEMKDTVKLAYSYANRSNTLIHAGRFNLGLEMITKAMELMQNKDRPDFQFGCYGLMAETYLALHNYPKVIEIFKQAEKITSEINGTNAPVLYNCLGMAYLNQGIISDAIKALETSNQIDTRIGNPQGLTYSLNGLGQCYLKLNQNDKAIDYFQEALKIEEENKYYMQQTKTLRLLAESYLKKNDWTTANQFLLRAKTVAEKENIKDEIHLLSFARIKAFLKQKDTALYHLFEKSESLRDSLYENSQILLNLDFAEKYETLKKEAENEKLKSEKLINDETIQNQRKFLITGSLGLIIISLLSLFLFRQKEKQKLLIQQLSKSKDQIQLLNRELNHRVKNNLAFMTSLLEMQGRRSDSQEVKTALRESESRLKALALVHSQLFKSDSDTEVNLKHYLQEVTAHLKEIFITKDKPIQFQTSFSDHQINAEDAMRLGLIVNELVTNSVKHAFSQVLNPLITIETYINPQGSLALKYEDNGPHSGPETDEKTENESLGLKLISLLRKQLGEKYVVMM
ncbi:MAG: tetratricopeptide repeat protein [Saprospiraceae bacterium]|nr:tetratricopeptide repeat protein [Saprospiraceae bacterium]